MKKRFWLAIGIIMLARLPFLHISFFSVDEAVSAVAAHEILEGDLPYKDAIDHRGPLTYYFYALVFAIFGKGNMWAIHLIYTFIHVGIAWWVYRLSALWWKNKDSASWAVLIYALISSCNYFTEGLAAHTEWLLSLFVVLAWVIFLQNTPSSFWKWLFAGGCMGLAITSKQVAALEVFVLLLAIWFGHGHVKAKFWTSFWVGLGVVLPILGFVFLFYQGNALEDLIFYAFTYNTQFYLPELSLQVRLLNSAKLLGSFALNNWITIWIGAISLWYFFSSTASFRKKTSKHWLILIWMLGTLGEGMAGGRAFGHYLIPAMVPLSIWGGYMLGLMTDYLKEKAHWQHQLYGTILILLMGGPLVKTFFQHKHMLGQDPSVSEYEQVSQYIHENVEEGACIFVWGFSPEIYILSQTRPSSRFTFCNPLTGHLPAANEYLSDTQASIVPGSWDSLAVDLDRCPPKYIVDTQPAGFKSYGKFPMKSYPFWRNYLKTYHIDSIFFYKFPADSIQIYKTTH